MCVCPTVSFPVGVATLPSMDAAQCCKRALHADRVKTLTSVETLPSSELWEAIQLYQMTKSLHE